MEAPLYADLKPIRKGSAEENPAICELFLQERVYMSDSPAFHPSRPQGEERQQCEGTSKRTGERCTAPPMRGERLCAGHAGRGVAASPEAARAGAEAANAGRREQAQARAEARKATLRDLLARQLEEHAETIAAALLDVIQTGTHADKLRAIEQWTSRVYGKPTERVETGPLTEPETDRELRAMTEEERLALIRRYEDARGMAS